jgi:hypothetical protein
MFGPRKEVVALKYILRWAAWPELRRKGEVK